MVPALLFAATLVAQAGKAPDAKPAEPAAKAPVAKAAEPPPKAVDADQAYRTLLFRDFPAEPNGKLVIERTTALLDVAARIAANRPNLRLGGASSRVLCNGIGDLPTGVIYRAVFNLRFATPRALTDQGNVRHAGADALADETIKVLNGLLSESLGQDTERAKNDLHRNEAVRRELLAEIDHARGRLPLEVRLHDAASYRLHLRTLSQRAFDVKVQHAGAAANVAVLEKAIARERGRPNPAFAVARAAVEVAEVEVTGATVKYESGVKHSQQGVLSMEEVQDREAKLRSARARLNGKQAELEAAVAGGGDLSAALTQQLELGHAKLAELDGQRKALPSMEELQKMETYLQQLENLDQLRRQLTDAEAAERAAKAALAKLPPAPRIEVIEKLP